MKRIRSFLGHKFFKDSMILMIGGVIMGACNYVLSIVLSHLLPVAEYGLFQLVSSLLVTVGVFTLAITYFIIRAAASDLETPYIFWHSQLKRRLLQTKSILITFGLVSVGTLAVVFLLPSSRGLFILPVFSTFIALIILAVFTGLFQGKGFFIVSTTGNSIATIAKLVIACLFALLIPKALFISWTFSIALCIGILYLYYYLKASKNKIGTTNSTHQSFTDTGPFYESIITAFIIVFISNIDIIIASKVLSPISLGYFGVLSICGKIVFFINSAVVQALLPHMIRSSREEFRSLLIRAYVAVFGISSLFFVIFGLFAQQIILLFDSSYHDLSYLLPIATGSGIAMSLVATEATIAYALHETRSLIALCSLFVIYGLFVFLWGHEVSTIFMMGTVIFGAFPLAMAVYRLTVS